VSSRAERPLRQDGRVPSSPVDAAPAPRQVDASISLLVDMMTSVADDPYRAAADRRARAAAGRADAPAGPSALGPAGPAALEPAGSADVPAAPAAAASRRGGPWRRPVVLLLLLALGALTGTAAAQVRRNDSATVRDRLADEVRRQTAESDRLAASAATLRDQVASARDAALGAGAAGRSAASRLSALELATAATAVTGPGVVVVLDDAEDAGGTAAPGPVAPSAPPRGGQSADRRVLDRDLQGVVNGLWAAGAEAVTINDLRLTARTAIRSAGDAVLVDFRPLSPPYTVRAVGDPATLEARFVDGPAGRRLGTLGQLYGLRSSVRGDDALRLPAASAPELRAARPDGTG
jgi:uncharacterized protein YlxW (UPF0749 family)